MFGSTRDVATFKIFTKEIVEDIVSQQVGYYKIKLEDTPTNIYGEALTKYYIGPVLIPVLIVRGDFGTFSTDYGPDTRRDVDFRFFKDHLIEANIVPEVGDVIMYDEVYYEINNTNENQLILGKDPDYSYSSPVEGFGQSYSIILTGNYTDPDKLGITKERL